MAAEQHAAEALYTRPRTETAAFPPPSPPARAVGMLIGGGRLDGGGQAGGGGAGAAVFDFVFVACASARRRFLPAASAFSLAASDPLLTSTFSEGLKNCHKVIPSGGEAIWPAWERMRIARRRISGRGSRFFASRSKRIWSARGLSLTPMAAACVAEQRQPGHVVSSDFTISSATVRQSCPWRTACARSQMTASSTSASCCHAKTHENPNQHDGCMLRAMHLARCAAQHSADSAYRVGD